MEVSKQTKAAIVNYVKGETSVLDAVRTDALALLDRPKSDADAYLRELAGVIAAQYHECEVEKVKGKKNALPFKFVCADRGPRNLFQRCLDVLKTCSVDYTGARGKRSDAGKTTKEVSFDAADGTPESVAQAAWQALDFDQLREMVGLLRQWAAAEGETL